MEIKFEKKLGEMLEGYSDEIKEKLVKAADKTADEGVNILKSTSPRKRGKYAEAWAVKKVKSARVIYNKEYGFLTHLLEFGHATRNGGRTRAFPHIKSAETKISEMYESEVKKVLSK